MRHVIVSLLFTALATASAHAAPPGQPEEKLPSHTLFRHLVNDVLLPLTDEFSRASDRLSAMSRDYCAASDRASLEAMRMAWRDAQSAWQPLEMLQLGPTIARRTQRHVNAWPVRTTLIDPLLGEQETQVAERVAKLGAAGKGLPAIEYLLFVPGQDDRKTDAALQGTRCKVLQALAGQVKWEAAALARDWREPDGGFAQQLARAGQVPGGPFASADQALSDIANLLIAGLDAVRIRKLGKALEKSQEEVSLERIEAWRSGTSLDHIRANLRGFELVFFGAGMDGIGLDDYLAGIGRPVLPRLVREDLEAARTALQAVQPPMQDALTMQREQVQALHAAVTQLQRRMENDIADALKIDLGFNANDGD